MGAVKIKRTPAEAKAVLTKRRIAAEARADEAIDALAAAAAVHRHEEALRVLEQIILRGGTLRLERLEDLVQPWPWVIEAQDRIADHLLMVEPSDLDEAVVEGRFAVMTLAQALQAPWRELDVQSRWISAYTEALHAIANDADALLAALRSAQGLQETLN